MKKIFEEKKFKTITVQSGSISEKHPWSKTRPPKVGPLAPDWVLIGGGAKVNWKGEGNLLTASYPGPSGQYWMVASKDHIEHEECTITA
ncbi:MAG TPA: hypothetical protein VGE97_04110 [Nitrososphaera sp.]